MRALRQGTACVEIFSYRRIVPIRKISNEVQKSGTQFPNIIQFFGLTLKADKPRVTFCAEKSKIIP